MATESLEPVPFLLLFRNTGPENYRQFSPSQRQEIISRWNGWFEDLLAQGKAVEGQPLELETRTISGPGGQRIVDGPYPEAKEAVAGYVILTVRDLEEATALAQRHPGLDYGLHIEVRQLAAGCHLGVTTARRAAVQSAAGL